MKNTIVLIFYNLKFVFHYVMSKHVGLLIWKWRLAKQYHTNIG